MKSNLTELQVNITSTTSKRSGYDLPIYGLDNGQFNAIHIPALVCISLSLTAVIITLSLMFKNRKLNAFFTWTKNERFVVYLAICDGMYNVCHSMDHLHIVITKDHVYPRQLCVFYGLMLAEFITAQALMVNVVSINAFVLIYFRKNLEFGKCDWKLLLWTFGFPFTVAIFPASTGKMGPNGTFCFFDGVKGMVINLSFTTVPLSLILVVNIIFYVLTWYRIRKEEPRFKDITVNDAQIIRASHRVAQNMSLFATAFFVQWFSLALYGIWQFTSKNVPQAIFNAVTILTNTGGILNGFVYAIIKKRRRR